MIAEWSPDRRRRSLQDLVALMAEMKGVGSRALPARSDRSAHSQVAASIHVASRFDQALRICHAMQSCAPKPTAKASVRPHGTANVYTTAWTIRAQKYTTQHICVARSLMPSAWAIRTSVAKITRFSTAL